MAEPSTSSVLFHLITIVVVLAVVIISTSSFEALLHFWSSRRLLQKYQFLVIPSTSKPSSQSVSVTQRRAEPVIRCICPTHMV